MNTFIFTSPDGVLHVIHLSPEKFAEDTGVRIGKTQEGKLLHTLFECSRQKVSDSSRPGGYTILDRDSHWNPITDTLEAMERGIPMHDPIVCREIDERDLPADKSQRDKWFDTGTGVGIRA